MKAVVTWFARLAIVLALAGLAVVTPAETDIWHLLAASRHMLETGQVPTTDPFSFTTDRPWINHEWLSGLGFYGGYQVAGVSGLVVLKIATIALLIAIVWIHARRAGVSPRVRALLVILVVAGTYWRMHYVRPQLFSVVLFAALLTTLTAADRGKWRYFWIVPGLFAVWVNLHGGWLVGGGTLAIWIAFKVFDQTLGARQKLAAIAVGAAALAATLLNPYGASMWSFLEGTVGFTRPDIDDWTSLALHPLVMGIPWLLCARVAVVAWWRSGSAIPWWRVAVAALLAVGALRVSRLDAFFAVAVTVLFAEWADRVWPRAKEATPVRLSTMPRGPLLLVGAASVALAAVAVRVVGPYASCMPVSDVPEPDAAAFVARNHLSGRVLVHYNWGAYVIWTFTPQLKVSMDSRRETVFSDEMIWAHWKFLDNAPGATDFLARLKPDFIWIPTSAPIVAKLGDLGWRRIFEGPTSTIFSADRTASYVSASPAGELPASRRCFPGP